MIEVTEAFRPAPEPKRHHFVPEVLLKRFVDYEGWLHAIPTDRSKRGYAARPANLFVEKFLYSETRTDGARNPQMEFELGKLESAVEPVLAKIVAAARAGMAPGLTAQELEIWAWFFVIQWKRVPDLRLDVTPDTMLEKIYDEVIAEARRKAPHLLADIEALNTPAERTRMMKNARVATVGSVSQLNLDIVRNRGIAVVRPRQDSKAFVIGSRPVAKLNPDGRSDLRDLACEMWLPIASDVAVGVGRGRDAEHFARLPAELVRHLNTAIASQSTTIAGRSATLVRSVARAR